MCGPEEVVDSPIYKLQFNAGACPNKGVFDFLPNGDGETNSLTFEELENAVARAASLLRSHVRPGSAVVLVYSAGLDFIVSFWGCLWAGVIPVAIPHQRRGKPLERLQGILSDCNAAAIVAHPDDIRVLQNFGEMSLPKADILLLGLSLSSLEGHGVVSPAARERDVCFLQYTSGSTSRPKGVIVTFANVMHNCGLIARRMEIDSTSTILSWLPHYHDMGLISAVILPVIVGCRCVFMPPEAFMQAPSRWLRAISSHGATHSGGPNFAFDECAKRIHDDSLHGVDLSTWKVAFNGAEAVRKSTLEKFSGRFSRFSFNPQAFYPCYGLAESTLFVSGGFVSAIDSCLRELDASKGNADEYVNCGSILDDDVSIKIVDPGNREELSQGSTGEIWVQSKSIAVGYWQKAADTTEAFRAFLASTGEGPFLRTGDLGYILSGKLYISGRLKELMIINGAKFHPNDLEGTLRQYAPSDHITADVVVSVPVQGKEQIVVLRELNREGVRYFDPRALLNLTLEVLVRHYAVTPHEVMFLKPGSLPRTTSGKLRRLACRKLTIENGWTSRTVASLSSLRESLASSKDGTYEKYEGMLGLLITEIETIDPRFKDVLHSDTNVHHLGLDSLTVAKVLHELSKKLKSDLPAHLLLEYPKLGDAAQQLILHRNKTVQSADLGNSNAEVLEARDW